MVLSAGKGRCVAAIVDLSACYVPIDWTAPTVRWSYPYILFGSGIFLDLLVTLSASIELCKLHTCGVSSIPVCWGMSPAGCPYCHNPSRRPCACRVPRGPGRGFAAVEREEDLVQLDLEAIFRELELLRLTVIHQERRIRQLEMMVELLSDLNTMD